MRGVGSQALWQIRQLMDHGNRPGTDHGPTQGLGVEHVNDRRLHSQCLERGRGFGFAGRADDMPPVRDKQLAQDATDDSRCAGNERALVCGHGNGIVCAGSTPRVARKQGTRQRSPLAERPLLT